MNATPKYSTPAPALQASAPAYWPTYARACDGCGAPLDSGDGYTFSDFTPAGDRVSIDACDRCYPEMRVEAVTA